MSSTKDEQSTIQAVEGGQITKPADHSPTQRDVDSGSDTGEKPVRERLEKTTIAKPQVATGQATGEANNDAMDVALGSDVADVPLVEDGGKRLAKKRSLEEVVPEDTTDRSQSPPTPSLGGHARKRSRDVQPGERAKGHRPRSPEPTVMEDGEDAAAPPRSNGAGEDLKICPVDMETPPSPNRGHANGPLQSPRRKRSRDEFDSELHRDQKIVATEESRARRSSDEERPSARDLDDAVLEATGQSKQNGEPIVITEPVQNGNVSSPSATKLPPPNGFSDTSLVSPFGALSGTKSPVKNTSDNQPQSSTSAFKSSSFAAMSGSASPFAVIGASSTTTSANPSATTSPSTSQSPFGALAQTQGPVSTSAFGSSTQSLAPSSGISGTSAFGSFGGNAFSGNSFGAGLGGAQKRTNWAAPVGDAQLGAGVKEKPFGASEESEEDNSGSDDSSEARVEEVKEKEHEKEGKEEESHRFRIQETDTGEENEDTIISMRGKLFQFHQDTTSWAERGTGSIKLNVTRREEEEEDGTNDGGKPRKVEARFIMRTVATHKVILNAPIFKRMRLGDHDANDPNGKQLFFSVPVDGKMVPYAIRMGKEDDIKTMYQAVKDLQAMM